jgi:hypothetical protein
MSAPWRGVGNSIRESDALQFELIDELNRFFRLASEPAEKERLASTIVDNASDAMGEADAIGGGDGWV